MMKKNIFLFFILLYCSISATTYTYLTWQNEDINTRITINFFDPEQRFYNLKVFFNHNEKTNMKAYFMETRIRFFDYTYTKTSPHHFVPKVKYRYMYVYSVELTSLEPDSKYFFSIQTSDGVEKESYFKTPPLTNVRFIVGGDMGYKNLSNLLSEAAAKSPHFVIIGGDIAYANGKQENFDRWLAWLDHWQKYMITKDNCIIPLLVAIGNHEVKRSFFYKEAPFYFGLFSQGKKSNFLRIIEQNTAMIALDSGHMVSHEEQQQWLIDTFKKHQDKLFKIAVYHVPLYPSHRSFNDELSEKGRKYWLPIFDNFKLTLGFEHHDHAFKRTKKLRNNQVVDEGTVYLGDGCFGKNPRTVDTDRFYIEKAFSVRHFWYLEISSTILATAIDENGTIIDSFSIEK